MLPKLKRKIDIIAEFITVINIPLSPEKRPAENNNKNKIKIKLFKTKKSTAEKYWQQ